MTIKTSIQKVTKKPAKKVAKKPPPKKTPARRWPVTAKFKVSQKWGVESDHYIIGYHTGTDFACPEGTPVYAPFDGVIQMVDNSPNDYGLYVELMGVGRKRMWLFAHLSSVEYRAGTTVKRGQLVAHTGNTGNTTGPHLHAEERHSPFGYHDTQKPTAWLEG